jgi:alginate O-acetyltransferase complex protein AlgI
MAIGLGRMFGFRIEKNFNYPYMADSISDFWRRWHISLGAWFRDYVYIPLGGNRCSPSRQLINLSVVWLLTGIWHGASWNFIVWGIYHGLWVIADKFFFSKFIDRIPRVVRVFGTALIAFFGWIFFFSPTLGDAFGWMGAMFGSAGKGFWNATTSYYFGSNLLLLIAAFFCCGPNFGRLVNAYSYEKSKAGAAVSVIGYLLLFVLCISNMIANSYSSFLYFRF